MDFRQPSWRVTDLTLQQNSADECGSMFWVVADSRCISGPFILIFVAIDAAASTKCRKDWLYWGVMMRRLQWPSFSREIHIDVSVSHWHHLRGVLHSQTVLWAALYDFRYKECCESHRQTQEARACHMTRYSALITLHNPLSARILLFAKSHRHESDPCCPIFPITLSYEVLSEGRWKN